jgi:uncharacterized membrane protein required for colicin V production
VNGRDGQSCSCWSCSLAPWSGASCPTTHGALLGATFGLARGVIVIGLLVLAGRAANLDLESWWSRTRSMAAAETVANWLERYARPAALELYDQATTPAGT